MLRIETVTLPGCRPEENPLPMFRERAMHRTVPLHASVEPRYRELAGWNTGARVLPYRVQDRYDRAKRPVAWRAVVLENAVLQATFLPEMGARLISLVHKPDGRELLSRNPVLQPANLAIRDAWFSGGIEWNAGQYGHSVFTCAPVFAAEIRHTDGSAGLRVYEWERMKQLLWQTDFYLPEASAFLVAHTRLVNPREEEASAYWWTNIAVPEARDVRVLAPAKDALYLTPPAGFGQARLPMLPSLGGRDATYATNSPFANEFFMQCEGTAVPFIAALGGDGRGFVEASTQPLNVRKLFCWGMHQGGRRWQEYLSEPGQAYIEIQAGLAPTQLHGAVMPPRATWEWTEVFGALEADAAKVHASDWGIATRAAGEALERKLPAATLVEWDAHCRARVDAPAVRRLQDGAGWGALEAQRRAVAGEAAFPPAFDFPAETLRGEPARWAPLLEGGGLKETSAPGEWLVQREWRALLEASLTRTGGRTAQALLHLGVMRYEALDEAGAEQAWRESVALAPSLWAERNLAVLERMLARFSAAVTHYARAWALAANEDRATRVALAREVMQTLLATGEAAGARTFFDGLRPEEREEDLLQVPRAQAALATGALDEVEAVLARELANLREGDVSLTDLWFELWARREAAGAAVTDEVRRRARERHPAPARIDFRGAEPTA